MDIEELQRGLFQLAQAVDRISRAIGAANKDGDPEPKEPKKPKKSKKPKKTEPGTSEGEIDLATVQQLGADVLRKGGADLLLPVLETHSLKNLSSAPEELWPTLAADLKGLLDE